MAGQPLAIRFRDPGEFIASVIEHHRAGGDRAPTADVREKTYLVFVGIEDEDGVFEMIDNRGYLPMDDDEEEEEPETPRRSWGGSDADDGDGGGGGGGGGGGAEPGYLAGSDAASSAGQSRTTRLLAPEQDDPEEEEEDTAKGHGVMGEGCRVKGSNPDCETGTGGRGSRKTNDQETLVPEAAEVETPERPMSRSSPEGKKVASPVYLPPATMPSSSPLSSPPPEEEEGEELLGESLIACKGPQEVVKEKAKLRNPDSKAREETGDKREAERGNKVEPGAAEGPDAANKPRDASQSPTTRGEVLLQIRELSSPIQPQAHEISPLTTPGGKPQAPTQSCQSSQEVHGSSRANDPRDDESSHAAAEDEVLEEDEEEEYATYPEPTLDILSAAECVEILYIADLKSLRAFLTVLQHSPPTIAPDPPLLAIWGLIGAHHSTDEFSGEGIGNTLSLAVDAAAESGRFLVLGEGYVPLAEDERDEAGVREVSWIDAEVPILSRGSMISGRTVVVRDVLGRWCRFAEDLE